VKEIFKAFDFLKGFCNIATEFVQFFCDSAFKVWV